MEEEEEEEEEQEVDLHPPPFFLTYGMFFPNSICQMEGSGWSGLLTIKKKRNRQRGKEACIRLG